MAVTKEVRRIVSLLNKRPITEEVAMAVKSIDRYEHLEIVDGEWIGLDKEPDEMTTGEQHGWIETLIIHALTGTALVNKSGRVYPGDVTSVLNGDASDIRLMREPDVAFVRQENVHPSEGFIYRALDLAVEIISPSQEVVEMRKKVKEYLDWGTQQVWLVIPELKEIEVHFPDGTARIYGIGDTIDGGELLPGFQLELAFIFEQ